MQGAWALLLSRYAGEEDVVFGATVSGRPAELRGVEETVGLFINTLPVRVRVDTAATVREWLEAMQEQQVRAREFEYSPLVEVKKWSDVPEGEPLFESLVVFENYPVDLESGEPVAGLQVRMAEGVDQANYPLVLAAHATDALALDLRYDRTRFDAETAERLVGHVEAALVAMASGAGRRLRELSLLSGAERRQVVEAWNATGAVPPHARAELFAEQAARTPDAPRCSSRTRRSATRSWSAGPTGWRTTSGAAARPETTVGMCLDRSAGMVVAILGILRPAAPTSRWIRLPPRAAAAHARDSGAAVALTGRSPPGGGGGVRGRRRAPGRGAGGDRGRARHPAGERGRPAERGVRHLHLRLHGRPQGRGGPPPGALQRGPGPGARPGRVARRPRAPVRVRQLRRVRVRDGDGAGVRRHPLPGDPGGAGAGAGPAPLPPRARRHRRDAPPSALAVLPAGELPALRLLMTAGEALPAELVDRWAPGRACFNLYGPTEATIWSTTARCRKAAGLPPIGRPIANAWSYLLDEPGAGAAGRPRRGVRRRARVARGYLDRPELTADRFGPDPLQAAPGRGCTGRGTGPGGCRRASWSCSAAPTSRSRYGASGSSWARWRPC